MKLNLAQHIKSLPAHLAFKIHAKGLKHVTLSTHLGIAKYIFALLASFACLSNAYAKAESAGVVTMTIGKAYLNGNTLITTGTKLNSGDDIETMSNGHVHIRFIDNGLVSVRPNSNLYIEQYLYNAEAPKKSVIKFNLKEGVMRSISGKGAKSARDKFRLNTPIAAIGVRGTDFVVKASQDLVQAAVNEGAIIVAPFSDACSVDTLGPCTENSVELTGDTQQLLELSSLASIPRLVPLSDTFASDLSNKTVNQKTPPPTQSRSLEPSNANTDQQNPNNEENTSSEQDNTSASTNNHGEELGLLSTLETPEVLQDGNLDEASSNSTTASTASSSNFALTSTATTTLEDDVDIVFYTAEDNLNSPFIRVKPDNYVPSRPLSDDFQSKRSLSWGRWSNTTKDTDRLITTRDNAKTDRKVAIADLTYILYRKDSALSKVDSTLADVSFNLVDAQATLTTTTGETSLMSVKDGSLNVNFTDGSFATSLIANHELTSDIEISGSGKINNQGFFTGKTNDTSIKGATTLDGKEASYLFYKDIDLGTVDGVTYWNR